MKKSSNDLFKRVYAVVAEIPYGKVTTYGTIAEVCGISSSPRTVGWAMNKAPEGLPCHRVINKTGILTGRVYFGDPDLMKELLIAEGVEFTGDGRVNMKKHLWIPKSEDI
ncbi:MGMT family protein [Bacteroidota bacterium]